MGNKQQRAVVTEQKLLQPIDGFNIQMVGGFVQQQQVRLPDQCACQQHPPFEPAGECRKLALRIELQACQHALHQLLSLPAVSSFQLMLYFGEPLQQCFARFRFESYGQPVIAPHQLTQFSQTRCDHIEYRTADFLRHLLGKSGNLRPLPHCHLSVIGLQVPRNQLH